MDRDQSLMLLRGGRAGVEQWNRQRQSGEEIPSLYGADLRRADLAAADLAAAAPPRPATAPEPGRGEASHWSHYRTRLRGVQTRPAGSDPPGRCAVSGG